MKTNENRDCGSWVLSARLVQLAKRAEEGSIGSFQLADELELIIKGLRREEIYVISHRDDAGVQWVWCGMFFGWSTNPEDAVKYAPTSFPQEIESIERGYKLSVGAQCNGIPETYEPLEDCGDSVYAVIPLDKFQSN